MNRWLLIGSLAGLLIGTTGCLHHNTRGGCASGGCASGACAGGGCSSGACSSGQCGGQCSGGACAGSGWIGKIKCKLCGSACGGACHGSRFGCVAGPLGWQQGGTDYASHLQPGLLGHNAARNLNSRPFTPGPPTAQVGYPYYTIRGPRDFLVENPPTIGR